MAGPAPDSSSNWLQIGLVIGEVLLAALFGFQRWLMGKVWDTLATKQHVTDEIGRFHQMDIVADEEMVRTRIEPVEREQRRLNETIENWRREWREDLRSSVADLRSDIRVSMQELLKEARKP